MYDDEKKLNELQQRTYFCIFIMVKYTKKNVTDDEEATFCCSWPRQCAKKTYLLRNRLCRQPLSMDIGKYFKVLEKDHWTFLQNIKAIWLWNVCKQIGARLTSRNWFLFKLCFANLINTFCERKMFASLKTINLTLWLMWPMFYRRDIRWNEKKNEKMCWISRSELECLLQ